jgi:hypothetical protein
MPFSRTRQALNSRSTIGFLGKQTLGGEVCFLRLNAVPDASVCGRHSELRKALDLRRFVGQESVLPTMLTHDSH